MAQIDSVVDEFRTIATAFTGIETFDYEHITALNTKYDQSQKPLFLLQKKPPTVIQPTEDHSFKTYTLTFGIYDDYNRDEKSTTDFEDKEAEIEQKMEQFIQQFIARSIGETTQVTTPQPWMVIETALNLDVEKIYPIAKGQLIATEATMTVRVDSSCIAGTFNY